MEQHTKDLIKKRIDSQLANKTENNMQLIKKEIENKRGGYFELSSRGDIGYIVGASSTLEDYYYVYIDKLNNIGFQSCVGKIKYLGKNMPNNDFSVVDWLIKHDPNSLVIKIKNVLQRNPDVLFTSIYINGKRYD